MKISKNIHSKGFTLVELLVVMAIIGALAGISFPIISSVRNSGKKTETKMRMREFNSAVSNFFNDTKYLPHAGKDYPDKDQTLSGEDLRQVIRILLNEDYQNTGNNGANYTGTVYLKMPRAKKNQNGITYYDGNNPLARSIVDAWGNGFYIRMDYDMNEELRQSYSTDTDPKIKGHKVIMLSGGADGGANGKDDVYSWE